MSVTMRNTLVGTLCAAALLSIFLFSAPRLFAAECPEGTQPVTDANLSIVQISNPSASIGTCWNSSDRNVGKEAGEAKEWLRKHATKGSNISCLDAEFAQKVKQFMESVPGGIPTIISAYRPPEAQIALVASGASKAGPCQSYHNYGLAVDFNNTSQISWMRANAWTKGLNIIGAWDPNHFQDARGRFGKCGECSNYKGDGTLNAPAEQSLSNAIRQALGQQPPPPPPPPPQQTLPPQQSLPSQPIGTTQPSSSAQLLQPTPISDLINTNTNTNANTNAKSTSSPTSTIDLINEFLDPVSDSIDIGKVVDIALNPDTSDASSLGPKRASTTPASGTLAVYRNVNAPQTFTTNDLANGPVAGYVVGENTFVLRTLDSMKNALLFALSYLKPFGGYPQAQIYRE